MTKLGINWVGPEINEVSAYDNSPPSGFSITSTPAPPDGTYWLTFDGSGVNLDILGFAPRAGKARYWACIRGLRVESTLSAGDAGAILVLGSRSINWIGQADGTYKVELRKNTATRLLATSSTSYAINTTQDIRWELNGSDIIVDINGSEEIRFADSYTPSAVGILQFGIMHTGSGEPTASRTTKINRVFFLSGDSDADRPDTSVVVIKLAPDGNGADDEWADHTSCFGADSGLADYTNWDDYAGSGTHNDTTDYNCGAAADWTQSSTCTTGTISDFVGGIKTYVRGAANLDAKTVNIEHFYREGGSDYSGVTSSWPSDTWSNVVIGHAGGTDAPPSGAPWTQAKVDDLEIGATSDSGNGANAHFTAVCGELVSVGDDPNPVPDFSGASGGVALGSANAMVY